MSAHDVFFVQSAPHVTSLRTSRFVNGIAADPNDRLSRCAFYCFRTGTVAFAFALK